ncbi:MAG: peptidoglycan hydrolase [Burkholderiaceae bacterium]|nr:peptidoglycan hydrolase [Burkholderiaceae bacterium]
MKPKEFVQTLYPHAKATEAKTGILAECILAQAALESGWGKFAPGNMYFGVKDFDGINGNEQLVTTFEYSRRSDLDAKGIGLASIDKIEPVIIKGEKFFKYTGKAYFRKYASPEESFTHHAKIFLTPRYKKALAVKNDPAKFFQEVQAAGYAQSPTYAETLTKIVKQIKSHMA